MTEWGWRPERTNGIWRYGAEWLRPFVAAAPFVSMLLLLLMFFMLDGALTMSRGVLFDLPQGSGLEGEQAGHVVLIVPMRHETMVFFDDSRYLLNDALSVRALGDRLSDFFSRSANKTLLVLADRRVTNGELVTFAEIAKSNGVGKLLVAEKRTGEAN